MVEHSISLSYADLDASALIAFAPSVILAVQERLWHMFFLATQCKWPTLHAALQLGDISTMRRRLRLSDPKWPDAMLADEGGRETETEKVERASERCASLTRSCMQLIN